MPRCFGCGLSAGMWRAEAVESRECPVLGLMSHDGAGPVANAASPIGNRQAPPWRIMSARPWVEMVCPKRPLLNPTPRKGVQKKSAMKFLVDCIGQVLKGGRCQAEFAPPCGWNVHYAVAGYENSEGTCQIR